MTDHGKLQVKAAFRLKHHEEHVPGVKGKGRGRGRGKGRGRGAKNEEAAPVTPRTNSDERDATERTADPVQHASPAKSPPGKKLKGTGSNEASKDPPQQAGDQPEAQASGNKAPQPVDVESKRRHEPMLAGASPVKPPQKARRKKQAASTQGTGGHEGETGGGASGSAPSTVETAAQPPAATKDGDTKATWKLKALSVPDVHM